MGLDFGNEQEMSVHEKDVPALGPTEEAQDVGSLNRIVVGMPAFTDPHNPMTQSGSVNLPLDRHPVTHSVDYGVDVTPGKHVFEGEHSPMAAGAATLKEDDTLELPADRDEWAKKHWQAQAAAYGLPTSGNLDTVKERVEGYEEDQEAVNARSQELRGLHREDLDKLGESYGLDPADYSLKDDLADAILKAETNQD